MKIETFGGKKNPVGRAVTLCILFTKLLLADAPRETLQEAFVTVYRISDPEMRDTSSYASHSRLAHHDACSVCRQRELRNRLQQFALKSGKSEKWAKEGVLSFKKGFLKARQYDERLFCVKACAACARNLGFRRVGKRTGILDLRRESSALSLKAACAHIRACKINWQRLALSGKSQELGKEGLSEPADGILGRFFKSVPFGQHRSLRKTCVQRLYVRAPMRTIRIGILY